MNRCSAAASIILITPSVLLLGHGYDLLVSYVAARNIVNGLSPYEGGTYPNPSYPANIQGIGETPLWPLWLSAAYFLSQGDLLLFNALSKLPIVLSLLTLFLLVRKAGAGGGEFYLLNPFVLMTTAAWGKPDVLAAAILLLAMLKADRIGFSAVLLAASLDIKPLALGAVPAFIAYHGLRRGLKFLALLIFLSLVFFFTPFILFGWNTSTPLGGTVNWLGEAGGLSPLNIFEYFYGWSYEGINPYGFVVGLPWLLAVALASGTIIIRRQRTFKELAWLALLGSTVFLVLRPRVSEQNLILPFLLIHVLTGKPPSTRLWLSVIAFSVLNFSVPQLLYPVWPTMAVDLYHTTWTFEGPRLVVRFLSSLVFYTLFFKELARVRKHAVDNSGACAG
ncbi:MAG: hypothetical protein NZ941_01675 [Candidatus Caldarchaeum sp.]|nr:hypothetical protein [Candidatus Caldarchaeum sp.]